jgi:predicted dehydrogenase
MYKALVIGCGNIGAGYDFDNDKIITHAKALYLNSNFELSVFDPNINLANQVAAKYHCTSLTELTNEVLKEFDLISLCSPTSTHCDWLTKLFDLNIQLIICEKPVSNNLEELEILSNKYNSANSKVLVNYVRRFQPKYEELKHIIEKILTEEPLLNIQINYQKGFINNCSHALDLVEYLLNKPINFVEVKKGSCQYDFLDNDPTLSLQAKWNDINLNILGVAGVHFGLLSIDLFFKYTHISIKDAGQTIEIMEASDKKQFFSLLEKKQTLTNCNKDFMVSVIEKAHLFLSRKLTDDNFLQSISLNKKMLNYLYN